MLYMLELIVAEFAPIVIKLDMIAAVFSTIDFDSAVINYGSELYYYASRLAIL